jgi:hypothetical protein
MKIQKTRPQIELEIYEIIFQKDILIFQKFMDKNYPKSRGKLDRIPYKDLVKIPEKLRGEYGIKS